MIYFERKPIPYLDRFIDRFWYCQAADLTNRVLTLPCLHHELVFNFCDDYRIKRTDASISLIENPISWVNGIQTMPTVTQSNGRHEIFGVVFKPNGLIGFTKYHSKEFENSFIDASLIFDTNFADLLEKLQNVSDGSTKITLIENYLTQNLIERTPPKYLAESIKFLSSPIAKTGSIADFCSHFSISNKSLVKTFNKYIGVSPAKFAAISRINRALDKLQESSGLSLTNLAYELDFFDQAHFTNSFKSITTLTPTEYSQLVLNKKIAQASPNFILLKG